MKVNRRFLHVGVVVPAAVLALLGAAFLLAGSAGAASQPAPPGPAMPQVAASSPDCAKPPFGTHPLLQGDDELSVVGSGGFGLSYSEYNNALGANALTLTRGPLQCNVNNPSADCNHSAEHGGVLTYLYTNNTATTTAAKPIVVFKDDKNQVALGTIDANGVEPNFYCYKWTATTDANMIAATNNCAGSSIGYLSAASGDLGTQAYNFVVVAFKDNASDLHVLVVREDQIAHPDGILAYYAGDTSNGRGGVSHMSVATGDLDGDGHKNEIVVAFKDSDKHLQVMIFKYANAPKLQLLWSQRFTDHNRDHVDYWGASKLATSVATGDLDGDFKDEVVVGLIDGTNPSSCYMIQGNAQLMVLKRKADGTYDSNTWLGLGLSCPGTSHATGAEDVAVSVGDFDGNGRAEVALAYTTHETWVYIGDGSGETWKTVANTYRYVTPNDSGYLPNACYAPDNLTQVPCLRSRGSNWTSTSFSQYLVALATGDLNKDGKDEIALSGAGSDNKTINVNTFNATGGLQSRTNVAIPKTSGISGVSLAMGDIEGDATWGIYQNACRTTWQTHVQAAVHAPPYWTAYNANSADASFGKSGLVGGGSGVSTESTYGSSLKVGVEFAGVSASFSYEFEKSATVEQTSMTQTVSGARISTVPKSNDPVNYYMDTVAFDACPNWCYDYKPTNVPNVSNPSIITACAPRPEAECAIGSARMNDWYDTTKWAGIVIGEPSQDFANSWVPVGINFARGKAAAQSSSPASGGGAALAVDGNSNGDYTKGSVSSTNAEANAWWQVDTVISPTIQAIQLWPRTDAGYALPNFYVFVSPRQCTPTNNINTLLADPTIWHSALQSGAAGKPTTIYLGSGPVVGRCVLVQLAGSGTLSLAEAQVWGLWGDVDRWPRGEATGSGPVNVNSTSFKIQLPDTSYQTVDGAVAWTWTAGGLQVTPSGGIGYDVSSLSQTERMTSGSTSGTATVAMGIKTIEGSVSTGTTQTTSRSMTWGTQTEFEGNVGLLANPPGKADASSHRYVYKPYIWMQKSMSSSGVDQAYLVQDYWVPVWGGGVTQPPPDATAPIVLIQQTPDTPDGANGWYTSTVTLQTSAMDYSGVSDLRCALDQQPAPATYDQLPQGPCPFVGGAPVSADGVHTHYAAAMDAKGNKSNVVTAGFNIDATPPVITCPAAGPFPQGSGSHQVGPAGVDAAVSGLDAGKSTLIATVTADNTGPQTVTFTATDLAGNYAEQECTYSVNGEHEANAGSAVPLKFSLPGDLGPQLFAEGYPVSQQVDCDTAAPIGDEEPAQSVGKFKEDYKDGVTHYQYTWKTDKAWAGTCRVLIGQFVDGTERRGFFEFN
jgi:hypothetical protein